jgi:hypothetical protein
MWCRKLGLKWLAVMDSTHKRHNDIVIERRFRENASTHAVTQVYAVTYPDHTDRGQEHGSYEDAERVALALAEQAGVSAWYEETPHSLKRTLLKGFRQAPPEPPTHTSDPKSPEEPPKALTSGSSS